MRRCDTLLHAAAIVTQDEARRVLRGASLAVKDGTVADMGPTGEIAARWDARDVLHLENALLLPGLVNAHTHASMTFLRGLADDMPLMEWLERRVFPVEQKLTRRLAYLGALLGFAEMLATGTTACQDMYIFEDAVLEAAQTAGLRCLAGEGVFQFPSAACPGPAEALRKTRDLAERYAGHDRLRVAVMPHSVYTTTPRILADCRDMARSLGLPLHIHLAETAAETAACLKLHGKRPVALCESLGLLDTPCSLAHVVDAAPDELDLLARREAVVAHNPSSNMKLASGVAPVTAMLERGIPVALGTDGAASNNRLSLFTEMRLAALLHKVAAKDPTALPAQSALDMATLGGAAALRDRRLGRLAVGGPADCVALDLRLPNMRPLYSEVSQAVYAATGMEARLTMVAGEILYRDGRFTRFDYGALLEEMDAVRPLVLKEAGLGTR